MDKPIQKISLTFSEDKCQKASNDYLVIWKDHNYKIHNLPRKSDKLGKIMDYVDVRLCKNCGYCPDHFNSDWDNRGVCNG